MLLPTGKYTSHVTATDGDFTVSQGVSFEMNAFAISELDVDPEARPIDHDHGQVG